MRHASLFCIYMCNLCINWLCVLYMYCMCSEGWLKIIGKLMSGGDDIVNHLSDVSASIPNLVPLCMSLLNEPLRYLTHSNLNR